jgi:hypothetical protein
VSRAVEARTLTRSRNTSIVILALLALLVAQAAAGLHALKHFGAGGDPLGVPGQHAKVCMECASFAPLSGAHGGSATTLVVAVLAGESIWFRLDSRPVRNRSEASYQSRAPPR